MSTSMTEDQLKWFNTYVEGLRDGTHPKAEGFVMKLKSHGFSNADVVALLDQCDKGTPAAIIGDIAHQAVHEGVLVSDNLVTRGLV